MKFIGKEMEYYFYLILSREDLSGIISELKSKKIIPNRYSDEALNKLSGNEEAMQVIEKSINGMLSSTNLEELSLFSAPEEILDGLCDSFMNTKSFSAAKGITHEAINEINRTINEEQQCLVSNIDGEGDCNVLGSISGNLATIFDMAEESVMVRTPVYYTKVETEFDRGESLPSYAGEEVPDDLIKHLGLSDEELSQIYFDADDQDILMEVPSGYKGRFSLHIDLDKSKGINYARKLINKVNAYCRRKYTASENEDIIEAMFDGNTDDY